MVYHLLLKLKYERNKGNQSNLTNTVSLFSIFLNIKKFNNWKVITCDHFLDLSKIEGDVIASNVNTL